MTESRAVDWSLCVEGDKTDKRLGCRLKSQQLSLFENFWRSSCFLLFIIDNHFKYQHNFATLNFQPTQYRNVFPDSLLHGVSNNYLHIFLSPSDLQYFEVPSFARSAPHLILAATHSFLVCVSRKPIDLLLTVLRRPTFLPKISLTYVSVIASVLISFFFCLPFTDKLEETHG